MAHTEDYKGYRIEVDTEHFADSPENWGNDDIAGWSRHFEVENKHVSKEVFAAHMGIEGHEDYKEAADALAKSYHVFGLDAYVHSGVSLSLHGEGMRCAWDTSDFVGCVIVAKSEAETREEAEKIAKGVVATWNRYLNGDVYTVAISKAKKCETCEHEEYELIDSMGDIYDDVENIVADARAQIDRY